MATNLHDKKNILNIPIYLDYSATTPVDTRVAKKMSECLTIEGTFGNPASRSHPFGWKSEKLVEEARKNVASLINADSREIIWTSGATESDNLAIKGAAHFYKDKGNHLITLSTEHKAVLDTMRALESEGFEVTYLDPEPNGLLDQKKLLDAITPSTILISIMHVNNEIGVIQDLESIGRITREKNIILHVDAAQSPGKVDIDVEKYNIDLLSLSAHKVYGPKGIGALYVRRKPRVRLEAQMHGGGHERGFRSGTLPTHQIVGMGEAFRIAQEEMVEDNKRILKLREKLWNGLKVMEEIYLNGDLDQRIPGNLNVSFNFIEGESLIMAMKDVAVSSGSACTSASLEPSYVLRALGRDDELAHSSIRMTIGKYTTEQDIDHVLKIINDNPNMPKKNNFNILTYKKALDFSYSFYSSKYRKGIKLPYFTYLSSVSNLVIENNGSTEEAVASLLHDIFENENGKKKAALIKSKFGMKVLNIIKQCSNIDNSDNSENWLTKKKKFLESMNKKSQSSLLVCICDKHHSLNCILNDYGKIGKRLWRDYEIDQKNLIWYYKSLCQNFKKFLKNHKTLKDKFQRNVNELDHFCKK